MRMKMPSEVGKGMRCVFAGAVNGRAKMCNARLRSVREEGSPVGGVAAFRVRSRRGEGGSRRGVAEEEGAMRSYEETLRGRGVP